MYGVTASAYYAAVARRRLSRSQGQDEPEGMEPTQIAGASNRLRVGVIAGVIVVVLLVTALVYSQHPKPTGVTISLSSSKVTDYDSSILDLAIILTIHNNTPSPITYWGASYSLIDSGLDLDGGVWTDHVNVAGEGTQALNESADMPVGDTITPAGWTPSGTWELQGTATELVSGANVTQSFDFNFEIS